MVGVAPGRAVADQLNAGVRTVKRIRRDHLAGLLVAVLGAGVLVQALHYDFGTMARVGPGFMPMVLGVLLLGVGAGIAATAGSDAGAEGGEIHAGPDLRGWCCIVASVLLFVGLAHYAGLAPAIFACVLVAALGDRSARLGGAVLLAAGMTAFGVAVFHYGLGVQLPLLRGLR